MKQPLEINSKYKEMFNGVFHLSLIKKIKNKQMKRILLSAFLFMLTAVAALSAQNTVYVYEPQVPILIERADNVLMYIRVTSQRGSVLNSSICRWQMM